jgi:hypothetical protein
MPNGRVVLVALKIAVLGAACEGPVGEIDQSADAPLLAHLVASGYRAELIRFDGDKVWVEEDAWMPRQGLLEQMAASGGAETELVEKGYWRTGGFVPYAKKIGFRFNDNVPQYLRDAVLSAASEWNGVSSCIGMGAHHSGAGTHFVEIYYVKEFKGGFAGSADGGYQHCRPEATAQDQYHCAHLGSNIGFSEEIFPRTPPIGKYDEAISTALHEIGHVLGFKHPFDPEASKSWVPGTGRASASCPGNGGTCKPAYASIMDYSNAPGGREHHLTADDRKTAQRIYHPSRPTCTLP